jgi:hypothetical protein
VAGYVTDTCRTEKLPVGRLRIASQEKEEGFALAGLGVSQDLYQGSTKDSRSSVIITYLRLPTSYFNLENGVLSG